MVNGIRDFKDWFAGFEEQYAIIDGTACDMLMSEGGLEFRATRDIDMVLIVEHLTREFGTRFWEYVKEAGYEHRNKRTGKLQFYRFVSPRSDDFPYMIELFSRRLESLSLPSEAMLTPLLLDAELSSLSAILLDGNYYEMLRNEKIIVDGIPLLGATHLILFKIKAWLDLTARKAAGDSIDAKTIRKHKNDVFRISVLLSPEMRVVLSDSMKNDVAAFVNAMVAETIDLKSLGVSAGS